MTTLQTIHATLASRFEELSKQRQESGGVVFFSEHSLSSDRLTHVRAELRKALCDHSLRDVFWSSSHLPLVIFATEVGYEYEGNGTDFWPTLDNSLGYAFSIEDRSQLSDWFPQQQIATMPFAPAKAIGSERFAISLGRSHTRWPLKTFDGRLQIA